MNRTQSRIAIVAILLVLIFSAYSIRLISIQVGKHEEFATLAAKKNSIRQPIYAERGRIIDRNGEILADNIPTRTVIADGSHIKDPVKLANIAAPFLEIPAEELAHKLNTARKYLVIRHRLSEERALQLEKMLETQGLRGLYFEQTSERIYPNTSVLCHVLGFTNHERVGVQGIENTMQAYLQGQDGFRHIERDRTGREMVVYRGLENPAKHGNHVELTIDMALQAIVEEEIDNAFRELHPRSIVGLIVNPHTGEILAMANRPNFDPNNLNASEPEHMKNRAIIDMVEPGSTFKIVAISGALNERVVSPQTSIFCENGQFHYGGRVLRDHHGYGHLSVHDILVKSSNIGSAKLAMLLGDQRFYEYIRRFGFGDRTGVELPGEISGLVHPPNRWSKISITRIPMGHEIAVTPIQIVMAMSAVANGGKLMAPQIVRRVIRPNGTEVTSHSSTVVREIITPEVAKRVTAALADVVSERGTATLAKVEGFRVAGKTGTAQRVDPNGGYTPGKYVVSFVGFMPAEDPAFVALVLVDDAQKLQTSNYGGLIAAPIFSRIAERTARYLDLQPGLPGTAIVHNR